MTEKEESISSQCLSVVMTVHNQAAQLERNLPLFLTQQYAQGYEVIVVNESSTDDTEEVLKRLKNDYPNLYTTYIPASSHYISRRKLALTVGIKAAHYEWVILTNADCHPESGQWLSSMSESMTEDIDLICGYTGYEDGTKGSYAYLRLLTWWRQKTHPFRHDGANLAIRKSAFMQRNGFLQNLESLRGEYDFLVNETPRERIAVNNDAQGRLRQEAPSAQTWRNEQMYYMDTRSHLQHAMLSRCLFCFLQASIHISYLIGLLALAAAIYLHNYTYTAIAAAFLLIHFSYRTFFGYRLAKAQNESIALWKMPFLDLRVAWHYLCFWLRYRFSNKEDFKRK